MITDFSSMQNMKIFISRYHIHTKLLLGQSLIQIHTKKKKKKRKKKAH